MIKQNLAISILMATIFTIIIGMSSKPVVVDVTSELPVVSTIVIEDESIHGPFEGFIAGSEPVNEAEDRLKVELCEQDEECIILSQLGYYESRSEPDDGVLAAMGSVLERVNDDRFPTNTIHEVVNQKDWYTYLWDGSTNRGYGEPDQLVRMKVLAYDLLNGIRQSPVKATHYHTLDVKPSWSGKIEFLAQIGNHRFYNGY